jgi:hypothetical protein
MTQTSSEYACGPGPFGRYKGGDLNAPCRHYSNVPDQFFNALLYPQTTVAQKNFVSAKPVRTVTRFEPCDVTSSTLLERRRAPSLFVGLTTNRLAPTATDSCFTMDSVTMRKQLILRIALDDKNLPWKWQFRRWLSFSLFGISGRTEES